MATKEETKKAHIVRQTASALGMSDNVVKVVVTEYERQRRAASRAEALAKKVAAAERAESVKAGNAARVKANKAAAARRVAAAKKKKKG